MRWRITIGEGAEIPRHFGIAYWEPDVALAIAYPIPVNHIVSAWRVVACWLMLPPWRGYEHKLHALERRALRAAGAERVRRKGFEDALRFIADMPEFDLRVRFEELEARNCRFTTGHEKLSTVMRCLASHAVHYGWPTERHHT